MAERLQASTGWEISFVSRPEDLTLERLASLEPRYVFFPHWSHRIEAAIHNRFECVIFHMTDLPFGRGGSPLQNLIASGIEQTQVCALRCVDEMDAGPVYLRRPLSLHGAAEEIFLRASRIVEQMIVDLLELRPEPVPQQGTPTIFKRRRPEQGDLASAQSLEEAFDLIRMLDADGYPNAFLQVGRFRLEFSRASRKTDRVVADVRITLSDEVKPV
jgi:methionyl-tRNA formyltransferase